MSAVCGGQAGKFRSFFLHFFLSCRMPESRRVKEAEKNPVKINRYECRGWVCVFGMPFAFSKVAGIEPV
jgi:hypothetical protein